MNAGNGPQARIEPHAFVLAVHDLAGETRYFVDRLGFDIEWKDDDRWSGLMRDGVRVMLGRCPDALPARMLGDHGYFGFIRTGDLDALHHELVRRGATILAAPEDKPWGWREMPVATQEGFRIMFAEPRS